MTPLHIHSTPEVANVSYNNTRGHNFKKGAAAVKLVLFLMPSFLRLASLRASLAVHSTVHVLCEYNYHLWYRVAM